MKQPSSFQKGKRTFIIHLILWTTFLVGTLWGVNSLLGGYAKIGEEVKVPDITGLPFNEAVDTLSNYGLTFRIQDTQQTTYFPTGHILAQMPRPQSVIKKGRTISLVIASLNIQKNILPSIIGEQLRSAGFKLQSIGIRAKDTVWVDSIPWGVVHQIVVKDKEVLPGESISPGDMVTLIVGSKKEQLVDVPDLTGLSEIEARIILQSRGLALGTVYNEYNETAANGTNEGLVYRQEPDAYTILRDKNAVVQGTAITVWMK